MKFDLQDVCLMVGVLSLESGVAAIYWPAALILLGALALAAAVLIERTKRNTNGSAQ